MVNLTNKTIPHHPFFSLLSYILSTKSQINEVQNQFDQLKFSANPPDGFGLSLQAQAFINIGYPNIDLKPGQLCNKLDVAAMPTISISPLAATVQKFKAPNVFTLIMSDANTLGMPDPKGNFRYFLENGVTFVNPSSNNSFEMDLNEESGNLITPYVGPDPSPKTGVHRYAWLLFAQPNEFKPPTNLSSQSPADYWDLKSYVQTSGLGELVAANFFSLQNQNGSLPLPSTSNPTPMNGNQTDGNNNSTKFKSPEELAALLAHQNLAIAQEINLMGLIKSLLITIGFNSLTFFLV